jgi:hypothetical protein
LLLLLFFSSNKSCSIKVSYLKYLLIKNKICIVMGIIEKRKRKYGLEIRWIYSFAQNKTLGEHDTAMRLKQKKI